MFVRWTLALGFALSLPILVGAEEWAQFRGPGGSATSAEKQLPSEWGADKNVAWKAKLPGYGWSCPVVWGDKVFVTTAVSDKQRKPSGGMGGGGPGGGGFGRPGGGGGGFGGGRPPDDVYKWELHCLNAADGKLLWKQTAAEQKPKISSHASNGYATETPVTDGERVYAYFGMTGVFCYNFTGKQLWKSDLGAYRMGMGHGTASSPVLEGDKLIVQCDNDEKSFLVALDTKTGKELWKTSRPERTGWSTPLVWKNKTRTEIVCLGSPKVRSYDPTTGKQLWELGGMSGQAQASAVATEELLYVGTGGGFGGFGGGGFGGRPGGGGGPPGGGGGFGGGGGGGKPLFAVKAGASGDITLKRGETSSDGVAWSQPQAGPSMASPLVYDGHLYVVERGGLLSCLDAKTGKQAYRERLPAARSFTSSPWAYEGKVFCLADDGQTYVVQAGPEFKLLTRNRLDEMCWSSPAVAHGALFLRTVDYLYCIKDKGASK
jgi:outer membrane protein assembly factor BamB